MTTISLRFYIYAVLFIGAIAFFMRYDYLSNRVKEQDDVIHKYEEAYNKQQQQIKDADLARTEYLKQIEDGKNEIDTLRNRVSSGATVLRIAATCPKLPIASTDTTGAVTASPELTEDARENYYSHRADENKLNSLLDLCVKTLQDERKWNDIYWLYFCL